MSFKEKPLVLTNKAPKKGKAADNYFTFCFNIEADKIIIQPNGHDRGVVFLVQGKIPEQAETEMGLLTFDGLRFTSSDNIGSKNESSQSSQKRKELVHSLLGEYKEAVEDVHGITYYR